MGLTLGNNIMVPHVGNTVGSRAQVYNRATQPPVAPQQLRHRRSCFTVPNRNVTWHKKQALWRRQTRTDSQALIEPMNSAGEELSIGPGTWEILKTQRVLGSLLIYISHINIMTTINIHYNLPLHTWETQLKCHKYNSHLYSPHSGHTLSLPLSTKPYILWDFGGKNTPSLSPGA